MLKVTKTPNFNKWKKELKSTPEKINTLGNQVVVEIRTNTQSKSQDKNERRFKPYSKKYAIEKAKDFGSSKVNLTRTGRMLNSITFDKIDNGIRFYFNTAEENNKAYQNTVRGRDFFGISQRRFKTYYLPRLKKLYNF